MSHPVTRALPALAGSLSPGGAAEDLLRALTDHTPVGVFLSDTTGACRFVNRRWCELTGLAIGEALGDGWRTALHPDDRERVEAEWADAAAEQRDSIVSYRFLRPDGTVVFIDGYASAFRDGSGELVGWVGACLDVTGHRHAEHELREQAQTDPLTGLPNRRAFDASLAAAEAEGDPATALILVDLDHFKQVNDGYGHQAGDDLLAAVAEALRRRLRLEDLVARLGGDEFAVLARTHAPARLAASLLLAVREVALDVAGARLSVTASLGVAAVRPGGSLLERADRALYRAKDAGRNRVASDGDRLAA